MGQIAEIETDILMDTGAVINAFSLRARHTESEPVRWPNCAAKAATCDAGGR
jgi:hypothetical protein